MTHPPAETTRRYKDCLALYLKHHGENVSRIEREMRALGHTDFARRILYARTERGVRKPGWIERFGWQELLSAERGVRNAESGAGSDAAARCGTPHPGCGSPHVSKGDTPNTEGTRPRSQRGGNRGRRGCVLCRRGARKRSPHTSAATHLNAPRQAARVSTTLPDAARHTAPPLKRDRPLVFKEFQLWLESVSPSMTWDWVHQLLIYQKLKKVTDGTCKRLMIFLPPRHGKSETVTVRYTAWRIAQDPSINVILGSYNQRLADRFSRKVRRVLSDDAAQKRAAVPSTAESVPPAVAGGAFDPMKGRSRHTTQHDRCPECHRPKERKPARKKRDENASQPCTHSSVFPFTQRQADSVSEWETSQGGTFRAIGVGSGVTGFGASLIVVDDPVKSRAEAESETYRDKVYEWFNDDLYTRLEPNGAIVLIQTRWHEDDLAGRLLKEMREGGEHWDVINLPALCEQEDIDEHSRQLGRSVKYDPVGRLPGEALCPERFDEEALDKLRRKLGSYSFCALYQQRPVPAEGGLFKRKWFSKVIDSPPPNLTWKRGYDLAVSTKTSACYTASAKCAFDKEGNLYIADVFRKRMEFPEQRRYIQEKLRTERNTEHGIELALHGQAVMQDLRREASFRGTSLRGIRVEADKITRALSWASLAEEGEVILVRGPWLQEFLDEVCRFPSGTTDDQVDAVSIAVKMCKERRSILYTF